ncbi:thioredoxin-disulfide reductase [Sulfobacillus acidophilus]|uniref:Thioredoxin reductase n=1 Tax=Sulfobacillus acidophilus TaxID=53633 RepID=A0ABS3AWF1_9FIRM|nr:thioredoxin-disulfide reductase [Sulfobacillus acidophilus]
MENHVQKVVIIGSGPAGWTAALYAARATLKPLVFEGSAPNIPGGQLMITSDVENYPGFVDGVLGPQLMEVFKKQAVRFGAKAKTENITSVDLKNKPYTLTSEMGEKILAHAVIISTGANAKLLGIKNEKELMAQGAGVSACATCDGAFYKDMDVAVIGGGDSAMEEASFLTRFAKSVTIVHRREGFRSSEIMLDRAKQNPKIKWELNQTISEILTAKMPPFNKDALSGIKLKSTKNGEEKTLKLDGLFVAIGHQPNTHLFNGSLNMDDKGYLITNNGSTKTNIEGIFACGDVQDSIYRQAVTAAGSGCMAAIDAERFLKEKGL